MAPFLSSFENDSNNLDQSKTSPKNQSATPTLDEFQKLNKIIANPFKKLTKQEADMIWKFRNTLKHNPQALPKFLLSTEFQKKRTR
ncbi:pi-3 kinase [Anaeramoeba ignava]|uniref:Pi-3 kinase n=1 Tax=Anaeramoeba ignava TaxID=1746090 RepID=A0A9Q0LSD4_ANAIG|nr:pi-3 kinase [Anaeramoeba ignava]